ncbi:MAG TPA: tetratricopeptide repeat protein [Deltaproteobacteria bacterium]|nr:tetratricopeptide repeat protein [Deltaproteobacteria bacterium]
MKDTLRLGILYINEGDHTAAVKSLLKAQQYYGEDETLQNALGYAYMNIGKNDLAIEHFNKALKIKPDFSDAMNNLGAAYSNKKEWHIAIKYYKEATKDFLYPTPYKPLTNIGWAHYKLQNYQESENFYRKALKLNPKYSVTYYGLGKTYLAMERIPEAVENFKKVIELVPNTPLAAEASKEIERIEKKR